MEVQIHPFLTSALEGDWSTLRIGRFTNGKERPVHVQQEAVWAPGLVWGGGVGRKTLSYAYRDSNPGLSSPQPSHYTPRPCLTLVCFFASFAQAPLTNLHNCLIYALSFSVLRPLGGLLAFITFCYGNIISYLHLLFREKNQGVNQDFGVLTPVSLLPQLVSDGLENLPKDTVMEILRKLGTCLGLGSAEKVMK